MTTCTPTERPRARLPARAGENGTTDILAILQGKSSRLNLALWPYLELDFDLDVVPLKELF
jgi:hypothetical protein